MEVLNESLMVTVLTAMSVIFFMIIFTVLFFRTVSTAIRILKTKQSIKLINIGYEVLTYDSRGVPTLLHRDKEVVTPWSALRGL